MKKTNLKKVERTPRRRKYSRRNAATLAQDIKEISKLSAPLLNLGLGFLKLCLPETYEVIVSASASFMKRIISEYYKQRLKQLTTGKPPLLLNRCYCYECIVKDEFGYIFFTTTGDFWLNGYYEHLKITAQFIITMRRQQKFLKDFPHFSFFTWQPKRFNGYPIDYGKD